MQLIFWALKIKKYNTNKRPFKIMQPNIYSIKDLKEIKITNEKNSNTIK